MAMVEKYQVSKDVLELWYNLVGLDSSHLDEILDGNDFLEERTLCEMSPFARCNSPEVDNLPYTSWNIDDSMMRFLDKLCKLPNNTDDEIRYRRMYFNSYLYILNMATNLNLMDDPESDNFDYELYFKRLGTIMSLVMGDLSELSVEEVIKFAQQIKSGRLLDIAALQSQKRYFYMATFTLLGMKAKDDIDDFRMFNEGSSDINIDKLIGLISQEARINILDQEGLRNYTTEDHLYNFMSFSRPSYRRMRQLNKEQASANKN